MNKKGFTLIEILAVIVIISIITLIGTISISGIRSKINKNMLETKLDLIIEGGKRWGQDNKSEVLKATNSRVTKTVDFLILNDSIETDETEPVPLDGSFACSKKNSNNECIVITNNVEGNVLNNLTLRIYHEHNRIYACIEETADNYRILGDDASHSEYGHLNYYCVS